MRTIAHLFILMCVATTVGAFPITYVEPKSTIDCSSHVGHLANFGAASGVGAGANDFDADGRADGTLIPAVTGTSEGGDSDRVFETIQLAVDSTDTGGIVYVLPGFYHEKVTLDDSITV